VGFQVQPQSRVKLTEKLQTHFDIIFHCFVLYILYLHEELGFNDESMGEIIIQVHVLVCWTYSYHFLKEHIIMIKISLHNLKTKICMKFRIIRKKNKYSYFINIKQLLCCVFSN